MPTTWQLLQADFLWSLPPWCMSHMSAHAQWEHGRGVCRQVSKWQVHQQIQSERIDWSCLLQSCKGHRLFFFLFFSIGSWRGFPKICWKVFQKELTKPTFMCKLRSSGLHAIWKSRHIYDIDNDSQSWQSVNMKTITLRLTDSQSSHLSFSHHIIFYYLFRKEYCNNSMVCPY